MSWHGRVISSLQSFLGDGTKLSSSLLQLWAELTLVSPLAFSHFCFPLLLPVFHFWPTLPVGSPTYCSFSQVSLLIFISCQLHPSPILHLTLQCFIKRCRTESKVVLGGKGRERGWWWKGSGSLFQPKLLRGDQGTLGSLGESILASNAHSHLVFGTVVWKLVGHPFLLLCLMDSSVPLRWREPPTLVEMAVLEESGRPHP